MISFVFDTSAFLSLESINLLDIVMKNFKVITSPFVLHELDEFTRYEDPLGNIAKRILKKKITVIKPSIKEQLQFISETDNEIFNLALSKKTVMITDDIKLIRRCSNRISAEFSTYFLLAFTYSWLLTKKEAIQKLEKMRNIRNWQDNIIYISTKEELNKEN